MARSVGTLAVVLASVRLAAAGLVADLASPDVETRRVAAKALADTPTLPPEAIVPLVRCLDDEDDVVTDAAVRALGHGGAAARVALTPLAAPGSERRALAARVLGRLVVDDPGAQPLVLRLFDDDTAIGEQTANEVGALGAPAVPFLESALKDENARVRVAALHALRSVGDAARPLEGTIATRLQDDDVKARREAAFLLARLDPRRRDVVPILVGAMPSIPALNALASLEPPPDEAVAPVVDQLLHGPDGLWRLHVAIALRRIGLHDPEATRALVAALDDREDAVRSEVVSTLALRAPSAPEVIPALARKLGDDVKYVRSAAAAELGRIGAAAVPALAAALSSDDLYVREEAVGALERMRPYPEDATGALIRALDDPSSGVRNVAAQALVGSTGAAAQDALARHAARPAPAPPDPKRVFTKAEIAASRSDADHKFPLELRAWEPLGAYDLVASRHEGRERGGEVALWAPVPGGYRRLLSYPDDDEVGGSCGVGGFRWKGAFYVVVTCLIPGSGMMHDDTIHRVEPQAGAPPKLVPVELEEPRDWYQPQLRANESVRKGTDFTFEDDHLAWGFALWNGDDPSCCPTAGQVTGTFTIRETVREDPVTHERVTGWRMVVQDGKRGPIE